MKPRQYTDSGAELSADGIYRYVLWRRWGPGERRLVVIGLNPSTADATVDDPTIRRCVGFAKREGCDQLVMLNLFALRSPHPIVMLNHHEPVGAGNDAAIRRYACGEGVVVAAWGVCGTHHGRDQAVMAIVPGLRCFGVSKGGHPRHPLYLRADTPLRPLHSGVFGS